jgi:hypothetical protein
MAIDVYSFIFDLRLAIGYLGEKDQHGWWGSAFLSPSAKSFLAPVFVKTTLTAQYNGVCVAAARVHDERIGLGLHYHLYRLPDMIERMAVRCAENRPPGAGTSANFTSIEAATSFLEQFCVGSATMAEGPVVVGDFSEKKLESLLRLSASHYLQAFTGGYQCFPYMRNA